MIEMTVGCDPEVFLLAGNKLIPSCGLVGGSKKQPKQITSSTWIQEDNVTVEFNVTPVNFRDGSSVVSAAQDGLKDVREYLRSLNPVYDVDITPTRTFGQELHAIKEAWIFGCDPDLDAYSMGGPNRIVGVNDLERNAGGHIHIGYDASATNIPKFALVILGELATLAKCYNKCSLAGPARAFSYGSPGAYRDKPYGFEYRTPSNRWLRADERLIAGTFTETVFWALNNPKAAEKLYASLMGMLPADFSVRERQLKNLVAGRLPAVPHMSHIAGVINESIKL